MAGVKLRRVNRLLQIHPVMDMTQEERQAPLILFVAPGRTESQIGTAVLEGEVRRERCPRALSRRYGAR